ncbi:hypothetical protein [Pseudochelatococcus sp. G4_1912]|uniref:hypothetical protein n=1 Tax=Pseudochelatococcus sp. G4_1912 TaxID=3114288 RepID=UPI0039C6C7FC
MWDGLINEINPTISAVSVLMISVSLLLLLLTGYLGSRALSRRDAPATLAT